MELTSNTVGGSRRENYNKPDLKLNVQNVPMKAHSGIVMLRYRSSPVSFCTVSHGRYILVTGTYREGWLFDRKTNRKTGHKTFAHDWHPGDVCRCAAEQSLGIGTDSTEDDAATLAKRDRRDHQCAAGTALDFRRWQ